MKGFRSQATSFSTFLICFVIVLLFFFCDFHGFLSVCFCDFHEPLLFFLIFLVDFNHSLVLFLQIPRRVPFFVCVCLVTSVLFITTVRVFGVLCLFVLAMFMFVVLCSLYLALFVLCFFVSIIVLLCDVLVRSCNCHCFLDWVLAVLVIFLTSFLCCQHVFIFIF